MSVKPYARVHEMTGPPMAYMELSDDHYVMRFRFVTLAIGFKGKASEKPERLVKAGKDTVREIRARLLKKCKDEALPIIIWRRRPRIEYCPESRTWLWSCRVATSPPLDFLPWQKDEGMPPQYLEKPELRPEMFANNAPWNPRKA